MTPRLCLKNITKRYPGIVANDSVSLSVRPGEIMAILGENGAGKSTLMKIISGSTAPDAGTMELDGRVVRFNAPSDARNLGISMVHQHFALFETLTVEQNIRLGLPRSFSLSSIRKKIHELGQKYGLDVDPQRFVADLTMGERQRVEILRALMTNPTVLILDEPTSVLTPSAVQKLFTTLRQLTSEGVSILFITHKLDEIRQFADYCTVLRQGKVVTAVSPKDTTEEELARLMIGDEPPALKQGKNRPGKNLLELHNVNLDGGKHVCGLTDVRLAVRAGEIVGIAGISGNGQTRLLGVCAGELPLQSGKILLDGAPIQKLDPAKRRALGLRFVPEERLGHGSVPSISLQSNTLLTGTQFRHAGFVKNSTLKAFTDKIMEAFHVYPNDSRRPAGTFSGGNLQKYIVGREILHSPKVLLIDQPTWGVDVGAATEIRNALMQLRDQGSAIVVVSEEIDELLAISDRIAVMYRGHLSPAVPKTSLTIEELGRWMAGLWVGSPFMKS